MDFQVSKKQFIIITVLIIGISAVIISMVIKNKNNSQINSQEGNIPNQSVVENQKDTVIKNENENKPSVDNKIEEEIKEEPQTEEVEIPTTLKSEKIINTIKQVENSKIFESMIEPTQDEIDDFMDIDVNLLDEYAIKMSSSKFKSDLYLILKPSENNEQTVMDQVKSFLINYENSWVNLDYKQYDLISNRKAIKRNGYLIYVVSSNNDEFLNIVRNNI